MQQDYVDLEHCYELQKIMDTKTVDSIRYFLVKWKGFSVKNATWEPLEHIAHLQEDIDIYYNQKKQKQKEKAAKKAKARKIKKKEKKTNKEIITEYLVSNQKNNEITEQNEVIFQLDQADKEPPIQDPVKQSLEEVIKKYKHEDSSAVIFETIEDKVKGRRFKVQKGTEIRQLSQKQVKMVLPFELSYYYQQQLKQNILRKFAS